MSRSRLQEPFMREVATTFLATKGRITRRLSEAHPSQAAAVIEDELRGLYHGVFVILDGGSALADAGLVRVVDDDGEPFDRFLHEFCFRFWPAGKDDSETSGVPKG
jgi:hypothetical protein